MQIKVADGVTTQSTWLVCWQRGIGSRSVTVWLWMWMVVCLYMGPVATSSGCVCIPSAQSQLGQVAATPITIFRISGDENGWMDYEN